MSLPQTLALHFPACRTGTRPSPVVSPHHDPMVSMEAGWEMHEQSPQLGAASRAGAGILGQ